MTLRQLQLFAPAKPLVELLGADFFRAVPSRPGVYIMTGLSERVLYVGQSGNLRQRLATYKNCNRNQLPRRIIRLIHQVERISWEVCPTPLQARLRENQLLRLHRPKFNRLNVYPRSYGFIGLKSDGDHLTMWLTRDSYPQENLFGAFKGGYIQAYAALVRMLWAALHKPVRLEQFPCGLLAERPLREYRFAVAPQCSAGVSPASLDGVSPFTVTRGTGTLPELAGATPALHCRVADILRDFLAGDSPKLLDWVTEELPAREHLSPFQSNMHDCDLESLAEFFNAGPRRNRRLRETYQLNDRIVPQEKLDDLILATT